MTFFKKNVDLQIFCLVLRNINLDTELMQKI